MDIPDSIRYKLKGKIWIEINDKTLIGEGKVILLIKTAELGSLRKAAEATGISYRQAWYSINRMNNVAEFPLIQLKHGGEKGGIAKLTEYGEKVISDYKKAEEEFYKFLDNHTKKLSLNQ
ncbi:MAG: LysR family transcriptional regulator [Prolixibacteraceae bacterium]|nr:LysR family transcriptional regulator [Prolixibacteraceae bacterium]